MRVAGLVVGVLLLAACSSGADGPGEDQLVDAVEQYSVAYTGGDAEVAYGMLSSRCRERVGEDEFAGMVSAAGEMYGEMEPESVGVEQLEGEMARVSYRFGVPALDQQSEPWTVEDGQWRVDDC